MGNKMNEALNHRSVLFSPGEDSSGIAAGGSFP
jgi:hypothetical protein